MCCICLMGCTCIMTRCIKICHVLVYYWKMFLFYICSACTTGCCLPLCAARPCDPCNANIPAWCCRLFSRALGIKMKVTGLENINSRSGGVVLINHQSAVDVCALAHLWPHLGRSSVVAKREVMYLPLFGLASWLWGTVFIDRDRRAGAINTLSRASEAINEKNTKLLFFPEGTRNPKDTLLPFKKGAFHIAVQSQCKIQPIVVSRYTFLNAEKKIFGEGTAIISILPEISTSGRSSSDIESLVEECYETMQEEYVRVSREAANLN